MFDKIKAGWALFHEGQAVADPAKWKNRQITATALGAVFIGIVQLAKAFNYDIPLDPGTATTIAAGIISATNFVLTLTTSKVVGLPSTDKPVVQSLQFPTITGPVEEPAPVQVIDEATRKRAEEYARTYAGGN